MSAAKTLHIVQSLSQPTEWRDDMPSMTGWYRTRRVIIAPNVADPAGMSRYAERRFFNGKWSYPVLVGFDDDTETKLCARCPSDEQSGIEWQGLSDPHPAGYNYALVLLGPFMTCTLSDSLDHLP